MFMKEDSSMDSLSFFDPLMDEISALTLSDPEEDVTEISSPHDSFQHLFKDDYDLKFYSNKNLFSADNHLFMDFCPSRRESFPTFNSSFGYPSDLSWHPSIFRPDTHLSVHSPPFIPSFTRRAGSFDSGLASLDPIRWTNDTQRSHHELDSLPFEDILHDLYRLSKDQHGCRFFQKQLQDQVRRDMIFFRILPHFVELMTDPFGNYLCQKLMEFSHDVQRTSIIDTVLNDIIPISLNIHGTRAVQKMIEFSTLPEQIDSIIQALAPHVVTLVKDMNGNHVIQKCLHTLSVTNKQFIYNAVSAGCVQIATHRHGCCVLQRCIDHSSEDQKKQIVNEIIKHALVLVQDPYGNYVVQYVLELGQVEFSDSLMCQFIGHMSNLSTQKYSSNVMEKCIRVAQIQTRYKLIEEIINRKKLEKLLKDAYANYVVQTALDFADDKQHQKLSESIKPLLGSIRTTSYCKRIQAKLIRDQINPRSIYTQSF